LKQKRLSRLFPIDCLMVSCLFKTTPFVESINAYVQDGPPAPGGGIVCTYRCQPIGLGRIPQPPISTLIIFTTPTFPPFSPVPLETPNVNRSNVHPSILVARSSFPRGRTQRNLVFLALRTHALPPSLHLLALPKFPAPRTLKQPERPFKGFGFGSLI